MGSGIAIAIALGALALVPLTFRSGVRAYAKIAAWLCLLALAYLYQADLIVCYNLFARGEIKQPLRECVNLIQVSIPIVAMVSLWWAFFVSQASDAGKILVFLFLLFATSTAVKLWLLQ